MLNKNKKFVNAAAYLTSPNKPKIQYVDREQMKDLCAIAMESLTGSDTKQRILVPYSCLLGFFRQCIYVRW